MINRKLAGLGLAVVVVIVGVAAGTAVLTPQEAPQPTKYHKILTKAAGEWEGTMTSYMMGPEPVVSKATESVEKLGEFWTRSTFRCDFMGEPFIGSAQFGYDPEKKKHVGTWIDSWSHMMLLMEGDFDEKTQTYSMRYKAPDWTTGEMVPHRIETTFKDDSYTSRFFMGEGEGTKTMTIEMKRKKESAPKTASDR